MRIAVVNHCRRRAGGAESYLSTTLPALAALGHELGLWHEWEGPSDAEPPSQSRCRQRRRTGRQATLGRTPRWRDCANGDQT
jgi:hypothetical protein